MRYANVNPRDYQEQAILDTYTYTLALRIAKQGWQKGSKVEIHNGHIYNGRHRVGAAILLELDTIPAEFVQ
jgi:ParB-like chromosome segregation protein Spo0J